MDRPQLALLAASLQHGPSGLEEPAVSIALVLIGAMAPGAQGENRTGSR